MQKQLLITLILLLQWSVSMASDTTGIVNRDIEFTTLAGEIHSLDDLLNSGKYVYVLTYRFPNA